MGNQAYAHKLLTGRAERFHTLRQRGGLSGFTRRDESEHDPFGAGHASTSISAALGLAEAKRHRGEPGRVVAVIGDGGLTGGLAFEALNHAGSLERDLVVVLNDNGMFISHNVGAMSQWLSRRLSGPTFNMLRRRIKALLANYPEFGEKTLHWMRRVVESTKALFTPGMLFEGLNFQYIGPVDGHDLEALLAIFRNVRNLDGPVLVHVNTQKGRGLDCAERDPTRFHGVGPFCPETGEPLEDSSGPPSYTKVFSSALLREAERRRDVVAITAAMPDGTGLAAFAERFPDRFYDVGIAEEHAVTFAAGLACKGLKPVVAIYSTFLQRAYDQLLHDVCLQKLPVVFALDRAGIVGEDGPTHHGLFDLSYLAHMPGMTVMAPADEAELVDMLHTALEADGPVAIRFPRGRATGASVADSPNLLEIGRGRIVYRPLRKPDACILTVGAALQAAMEAAKSLKLEGHEVVVADARFRKPLDLGLIDRLCSMSNVLITVEENVLEGGFGQAVAGYLCDKGMSGVRLRRVGVGDAFVPHGSQKSLREELGLDAEGIKAAVKQMLAAESNSSIRGA
ncbi:MAG: 1-deoxy-D-xylulose-5-phosphate synthase [Deltaproteobacteria bacterium]|nr:MAG: 1-deoxy-D-xylulose-5-phosphate synthase [Deltaproteobacteria bacterium]